jgi:cytochrome c553
MLTKKLIFAFMFILMLVAGGVQAGGDPARGEELAVDCGDCHGEDGLGDEDYSKLAGLDEAKHIKLLQDYKSGAIVDDDEEMLDYVAELSDQDMADLAAYYATMDGG